MKPSDVASPLQDDLLAVGSGFFLLVALSSVVSFFANSKYTAPESSQPVVFDHRIHVEGEGLDCSACHPYYEEEVFSGLPTLGICALCHNEVQGESAEEAKVVRAIEGGVDFEWAPLFRQPPHVFFSHRRHVVAAGLECATCHGDIGLSEAPPTEPHRLTMEECIACHDQSGVAQACASCHR